jgi:membrane-associated phospholipid phosphatase
MAEEVPLSASLIAGLFSIGLFFLVIYALRKISYDKFRSMRKTGLLLVLFVILEMVLVNVVKVIWGRPRMRIIESYEQFTKWYEIVGPAADNNFKSFPSGHTANGFVTIAIPLVLSHFKLNRKWVLPVCLTWGSLVALSRVVLGAHFLSDVTVGAYISILIYFTLESIIKPKNK